jgi:hypothetical protein
VDISYQMPPDRTLKEINSTSSSPYPRPMDRELTHAEKIHAKLRGMKSAPPAQAPGSTIIKKHTQPLAPISPNPLRRDLSARGGWSGEAEHFTVEHNVISIRDSASDGDYSNEPSDDLQKRVVTQGMVDYYKLVDSGHVMHKHYLEEIGKLCAFHVLEKCMC